MRRTKNPFPGVSRQVDRHGKVRFRLRKKGIDMYLPGTYGSLEFRTAYENAVAGIHPTAPTKATAGSLAFVIEQYLKSSRYIDLSDSRKRSLRREIDGCANRQAHSRSISSSNAMSRR